MYEDGERTRGRTRVCVGVIRRCPPNHVETAPIHRRNGCEGDITSARTPRGLESHKTTRRRRRLRSPSGLPPSAPTQLPAPSSTEPCPLPPSTSDSPLIRVQENWGRLRKGWQIYLGLRRIPFSYAMRHNPLSPSLSAVFGDAVPIFAPNGLVIGLLCQLRPQLDNAGRSARTRSPPASGPRQSRRADVSWRYCQVDEKLVDRPPRYWA